MEDGLYTLQALLRAPAVEGDLDRLRYLIVHLPLLVSRIDTAVRYGDRTQLGTLAHSGRGVYEGLGQAGDHFRRIYAGAISASPGEMEAMLEGLRSEAAKLGEILKRAEEAPL
jgi:hypothetical protein